jgi:hypothetical protein
MGSLNKRESVHTHEGAKAGKINSYQELRRTVLACMLWENQFYESGESIADRVSKLVKKVKPEALASLAIEARTTYKLRHMPLLLARELARNAKGKIVSQTIASVIRRADELTEFLAIYWKDGKQPLSAQVKKGLGEAFKKFDEYQLAKYNRDGPIKLRDVLFMCRPKPKDDEQAALWKRLADKELKAPDTWEVALSGGEDKKQSFERLLKTNKLGYMALLRNLRNMKESGVDQGLVFSALAEGAGKSKVLPFRYIAAARAVPSWERQIDQAMISSMQSLNKLPGKTIALIDVSYSMIGASVSKRSELDRLDAACALSSLLVGICDDIEVYSFSYNLNQVPTRQGMALIDAIKNSQPNGGTYLGGAVNWINQKTTCDRLIVFTDEQSHDPVPAPKAKGYMVNVASFKNGIDYGSWTHITGFSESVVDYIREVESMEKQE